MNAEWLAVYLKDRSRPVSHIRRRKDNFLPHFEPFRRLNTNEITCITRSEEMSEALAFAGSHEFQVSYQALTGGFTICNIIVNGQLYSGSSHCSKVDRWLPIRGQMLAFKRALESTGITLPTSTTNLPNDVNNDNEF